MSYGLGAYANGIPDSTQYCLERKEDVMEELGSQWINSLETLKS